MSDSPSQNDNPEFSGGWHNPTSPTVWKEPEKEEDLPGWSIPALPEDLEEAPSDDGGWHLPKASDTTFTADDEIAMTEAGPVTDNPPPSALRPEDFFKTLQDPEPEPEQPLRPEDIIAQIVTPTRPTTDTDEATDDELPLIEEDDDFFSMSELMALQSLQDAVDGGVIDEDVASADLSPAERALFQAASEAASELPEDAVTEVEDVPDDIQVGEDAADVAKRMLEQLKAEDSGEPAPALDAPPAGTSAADYARQQLDQLDDVDPGTGPTPIPYDTQPYDPASEQLAQNFRNAEQQVSALQRMYADSQISYNDLQEQLRQNMVLDPNTNVWWMMGVQSGTWYKYENGQWLQLPMSRLRYKKPPLRQRVPVIMTCRRCKPMGVRFMMRPHSNMGCKNEQAIHLMTYMVNVDYRPVNPIWMTSERLSVRRHSKIPWQENRNKRFRVAP